MNKRKRRRRRRRMRRDRTTERKNRSKAKSNIREWKLCEPCSILELKSGSLESLN